MKILVIGSGAREHAIAEAFHRSSLQSHVYISPGNPGIAREFECEALETFEDIEDFCIIEGIDFVFVGPEQPLAEGLADHLRSQRIKVIGPSKAAARIESSKSFAKNLMKKYNIPTANFELFNNLDAAISALPNWQYPLVIKADGLASGKGVFIAYDQPMATKTITELMSEHKLGAAGESIVLEEFLEGWEVSLFAFTDGENFATTIFAQDHKQLLDGDRGPNTGGMGAYAPIPEAEIYRTEIENQIIKPALQAMKAESSPYQGILYVGLMITKEGPKVVEFNCRLGDPETETILPLLETDLVQVCKAILDNRVNELELKWLTKTAVCVIAAGKEYPYQGSKGVPISYSAHIDAHVFYSAVDFVNNELVTNGGRVLAVTAVGNNKIEARTKVYHDLTKVYFEGMQFRGDIGLRDNKF